MLFFFLNNDALFRTLNDMFHHQLSATLVRKYKQSLMN